MPKLKAALILEILGRPEAHVKEALQTLVLKLGAEKGIKILEKTIHDTKPLEEAPNMFTTFAELLVELDGLENYFAILFAYMPAHVELIEPESITLSNANLNELANKLLSRLHEYDAVVKKSTTERDILLQKLQEVAPQLFKKEQKAIEKINNPKKSKAKKKPGKKKK
ncbi:hypothetical protein CMI48_03420 [Candidatus Pacearchaeota archaeon]|jgi:hypothetical protein|nr:hypothetical protein [Candidatus Pacearchaeota archaeon]